MTARQPLLVAYGSMRHLPPLRRCIGVSAVAIVVANCASEPNRPTRLLSAQNQREIGAFADKRKWGTASPRVVEYGETVPKGGGRDHVGRPYRVAGRWYTPRENPNYSNVGHASWYGDAFHGRKTANGEVYDKHSYTAAHPTMPLPSYARVTNLSNQRSMIVRVNDRGPFHGGRIIDLSERVAYALEFKHIGTARVKVDFIQRASTAGSDDRFLVATLRTDGAPAQLPGSYAPAGAQPIMVASNTFTPTPASALPSAPHRTTIPVVRQQTPAQLALEPTRPASPAVAPVETLQVAEVRPVRRSMPLPQDRPFELGSIPGAGTPMDRVNNGQAQGGTPRPQGQRVAAVFFAPAAGFEAAFGADDPMSRLRPGGFEAVAHQPAGRNGALAR